ncbi:hypothetical protein [Methanorbis rubei]|uniref:Uncharacterized protein n=1 Tax=Methanorbis rubei TaxID=3028300 RepID=A0AAE4SDJ6_9EURY|nr:hypothetical protein [Methanocorpusculaceae archaeon Cs1]
MITKDLLITRISSQIQTEEEYGRTLEKGKLRLARTKYWVPIPAVILIIWGLISAANGIPPIDIMMLWVVGSFFIYMFYFFLMMIPSLGSDSTSSLFDGSSSIQIREFLRLANLLRTVRKNKVTFLEIFWNAFLINAKPLAKGFAVIYLTDLICAGILYFYHVIDLHLLLIIIVQIAVILIFYTKIVMAEPDTPGFFIGKSFSAKKNDEGEVAKLKIWLYISGFAMFTGLLIVGAMMFPGLTLGQYLAEITILPTEFPIILILVLVTQAVIVRYLQGIESRKLMAELNSRHLAVLEDDLLVRVKAAEPDQLDELLREFLLLKMNKLMVQEFFKRFPAYALVPNFLLIGDPTAREVLNTTGDTKRIRELL